MGSEVQSYLVLDSPLRSLLLAPLVAEPISFGAEAEFSWNKSSIIVDTDQTCSHLAQRLPKLLMEVASSKKIDDQV